ncbi:hypothetical protein GCWU000282_02107 [Catonella morbi ATCC 51271]|uniref:Uncharacterized protein n=1 Tax=Catonella morbi ATCC 51271 TaxID=592026 RepID=V2Y2P4_9FIRM|nr:hypothetical protein GCWU000282_02107 [Catonella morbi ATCC 51271]
MSFTLLFSLFFLNISVKLHILSAIMLQTTKTAVNLIKQFFCYLIYSRFSIF